jgi:hypothetical protein
MPAMRLWGPKIGFGLTGAYLLIRAFWRFFVTGQPVKGDPKDNATFLHEATADLSGRPVEKLGGPLWRRLAWRWLFLGVPLILLDLAALAQMWAWVAAVPPWLALPWPYIALGWEVVAVLGVAGWGAVYAVHLLRTRRVTNEYVYPAWLAACTVLGLTYHARDARRMVQLPAGFTPAVELDPEPVGASPVLVWLLSRQWAFNLASRWLDFERTEETKALELEMVAGEIVDDEPAAPSAELVPIGHFPVAVRKGRAKPYLDTPFEPAEEAPVRIQLPIGKCGADADKKRLVVAVSNVLGMPDVKARWDLIGRHPFVDLTPNHPPPREVTFADIKRAVEAADIDHPVVGLGPGRTIETLDFIDESPHQLVNGPTGTGKSTLMKLGLCQRMHLGAGSMIADFKLLSHRWAHDLPGCRYCWRIEDIHEMCLDLGLEIQRRKETAIVDRSDPDSPLRDFGVLDVVLEELNSLSEELRRYWSEVKEQGDPQQSPAVQAIRDAINMGREFRIFVWVGSQRASAAIFGPNGGDARESFGTRLLSGWTVQTWKMLVGNEPKFQRFPSGPRGIWGRVQHGELHVFRVPRLSNAEARAWALSGVPSPGQPGFTGEAPGPAAVEDVEVIEAEEVTLREAVVPGVLPGPPLTIGTLRQYSLRPGFPEKTGRKGKDFTYPLDTLKAWRQAALDSVTIGGMEDQFVAASLRPGVIYAFNVRDVADLSNIIVGYVGKTVRGITVRQEEHIGGRPWADLIVGDAEVVWESDACTPEELDAQEQHYIRLLKPVYNWEFQEGKPWVIGPRDQVVQRQDRQRAAGLPQWVPRDIYEERRRG